MIFLLTLAALAAGIYLLLIKSYNHWKNLKVPCAKYVPILGSMPEFTLRQKSLADCTQEVYNSFDSRYIGFYQFLKPSLMIKDPELLKQICVKKFDHFTDHRTFISEESDPLFGKNLFSLKGQKWRQMRATLSPAFTGSKMRSMFMLINELAEQFVDHFMKKIGSTDTKTLEMKDTFTRFANDVIASSAFGIKCDSLGEPENEFYLMGKDVTNFRGWRTLKFIGYNISSTLMQLFKVKIFRKETMEFFQNLITSNIAMRERENIIRPDMIHLLMEARKGLLKHEETADHAAGFATVEESQVGKAIQMNQLELNDEEITAQGILFFLAGFDTISSVLSHCSYELTINEDVQRKLQNEIDAALKECNGKITYEKIIHMKYLDNVISETIRKWPPVPTIDRVCTDPFVIEPEQPGESPVPLQKNDVLWIPIYALHRDPNYYPNPDKFDPERFNDENKGNINPLTYVPFGMGPRNCIGSRFALLEAKAIFFHILSKFNLVVVEKTEIPLQITKSEFNMNAQNGFWIGFKRR